MENNEAQLNENGPESSVKLSKTMFYVLSCSWGAIMTLIGLIVAAIMLITGHKAHRFGWCWYFEIGENWGGCEYGPVFLKCRRGGSALCEHEFGHAIQNCIFGPLMYFIVSIPSAIRYWCRRIGRKIGSVPKTRYDDIWFEHHASELGRKYACVYPEFTYYKREILNENRKTVPTERIS